MKALAGGEEGFTQLAQWAATTLPAGEIEAYNAILDTGDVDMIKLAVEGMVSKRNGALGSDGNMVHGGVSGARDVYESIETYSKEMSAARASGSPERVAEVTAKALRSPAL
jgi:hypothetical protein